MTTLIAPTELRATTPDPRDAPSLGWGILGPGVIASVFADALTRRTSQRIVAVGSRSEIRAQEFTAQHGQGKAYGGYAELVNDPDVDVVYVSTPHAQHEEHAMLAIAAGKHVLVEKPFTTSAASADRIIAAARDAGVFAMEGMWTRYRPQASVVRDLIEAGAIGTVRTVLTDFSDPSPYEPDDTFPIRASAGGVVHDIGAYPLSWASWLLGDLTLTSATGTITPEGYEDSMTVLVESEHGESIIHGTWRAQTRSVSVIGGSRGRIEVDQPFYEAPEVRLYGADRNLVGVWQDTSGWEPGDGLAYEAAAVARFIDDGLRESPVHSLDETRHVIEVLEAVHLAIHDRGRRAQR